MSRIVWLVETIVEMQRDVRLADRTFTAKAGIAEQLAKAKEKFQVDEDQVYGHVWQIPSQATADEIARIKAETPAIEATLKNNKLTLKI